MNRGLPKTKAAEYIGCSPRKFFDMVRTGDMPSPRKIGEKKVWDRVELDEAFEALPRHGEGFNEWDAELSDTLYQ